MRRGRFAPTPSGQMHIGNARTALLTWLQMRQAGGEIVLRLEDLDRPRCRTDLALSLLTDLKWLGLDWDEGPDRGGPFAPYSQSEREERYHQAVVKLQAGGWLYPCYCSRAQIMAIASAPHGLSEEGPRYKGTCRHLSPEEAAANAAGGRTPSLRFKLPPDPLPFADEVAGPQQFDPAADGDFVVMRGDGIFGYQLAVVVDDATMQITDVVRGWDLLDSTPRQLRLYQALGLKAPRFAHVPLLYGPDGSRLSKRHRSLTLAAMRQAGTTPETVVGHLAHLSGLIDRPEPLRAADLIPRFALSRIKREPVVLSEGILRELSGG